MPDDLSKPSKQTHVPVVPSHVPWPEHVPSPGQSNTDNMNKRIPQLVFFAIKNRISLNICINHKNKFKGTLLEQSAPCLPISHEHCPVDVSHIPALLQSEGQVNSTKENQNG